ncbi:MAG: hypothetical protein AAF184_13585 [Pseudomonadota bacterium]
MLLRGATFNFLVALAIAWLLMLTRVTPIPALLEVFRDTDKLLSSHLDFLIMGAMILGFYGARIPLPGHVRWAMVIGAVTNSSLFLLSAMEMRPPFGLVAVYGSVSLTTYGFGMASILVFRASLR